MSLNLTSRDVERSFWREVTVRRPSRVSNTRVLWGVERRAQTRVRRVEDWIAGQFEGSRRSRRSYWLRVRICAYRGLSRYVRSCRLRGRRASVRVDGGGGCLG